MTQWGNVRMPQSLINEITEYIQTDNAKEHGYTNTTQFVNSVIRNKMDELMKQDYHIVLRNKQSDTYLDLVIKDGGRSLFCKECHSDNCEHVSLAITDAGIKKILKKNGFSLPKSIHQKLPKITPKINSKTN